MIQMNPIGVIHTPFDDRRGMPIQPSGAGGVKGTVEVYEPFQKGLKDLDGFSHIILIYAFHLSEGFNLEVVPFLDTEPRGLFSTRAPKRPNPVGLSTVRLKTIENGVLFVENVDMINGTPLLDIKPYVPDFDRALDVRTGWLENARKRAEQKKSDARFT